MSVPTQITQSARPPLFKAVTSSTRPIFQLLKCINFTTKVHVQLSEEGIRFTADNARVMQGTAFLDKNFFTLYDINIPPSTNTEGEQPADLPTFQINLPSLLEALQIFGAVDNAGRVQKSDQEARSNLRNYRPDAFSNQVLGISGYCSFTYDAEGSPLSIAIHETGVKTTANITTYLPETTEDIPFDRDDLAFKIIMPSRHLLDAMSELATSTPDKLVIVVTRGSPYLRFSGRGDLGASTLDFARGRELLETFSIQDRWSQSFRFDLIRGSTEAMRIATKVAFRGDQQGVLSWNFMVDIEGGSKSFLNFVFVPYAKSVDDDDDEEEEGV